MSCPTNNLPLNIEHQSLNRLKRHTHVRLRKQFKKNPRSMSMSSIQSTESASSRSSSGSSSAPTSDSDVEEGSRMSMSSQYDSASSPASSVGSIERRKAVSGGSLFKRKRTHESSGIALTSDDYTSINEAMAPGEARKELLNVQLSADRKKQIVTNLNKPLYNKARRHMVTLPSSSSNYVVDVHSGSLVRYECCTPYRHGMNGRHILVKYAAKNKSRTRSLRPENYLPQGKVSGVYQNRH
jgi:hypothetical protein